MRVSGPAVSSRRADSKLRRPSPIQRLRTTRCNQVRPRTRIAERAHRTQCAEGKTEEKRDARPFFESCNTRDGMQQNSRASAAVRAAEDLERTQRTQLRPQRRRAGVTPGACRSAGAKRVV
eukprot:6190906-Pleurochrysis_carterae.AAC.2